jgi:Phage head completion protein (GPL)
VNGLVSTPAAPASPQGSNVVADGWFPDVDINALRDKIRIGDGIVTHVRMVSAIEGAMVSAFRALATWRTKQALAGVVAMEDIGEAVINGKTLAVVIWERIITYYTAAELADTNRDVSATDQGSIRADEERLSADDYRRMAYHAVADMLSIPAPGEDAEAVKAPRNTVSLI